MTGGGGEPKLKRTCPAPAVPVSRTRSDCLRIRSLTLVDVKGKRVVTWGSAWSSTCRAVIGPRSGARGGRGRRRCLRRGRGSSASAPPGRLRGGGRRRGGGRGSGGRSRGRRPGRS